jgi:hypothetical protein
MNTHMHVESTDPVRVEFYGPDVSISIGAGLAPSRIRMTPSQGEAMLAQLKRLFGQAETTKPTREQELDLIWRKLDALGGPFNRFDPEEVMFDRRLGVAMAAVKDMGGMDPEERARRSRTFSTITQEIAA